MVDRVEAGDLDPRAARAMCDQLKWLVSKWYPRTYGDHSSKTVPIEPGAGYAALLEEIDKRRIAPPPVIDVVSEVVDD